jgi:AAHS family 4-hydroxybenzoate transporter-like MFS transporter
VADRTGIVSDVDVVALLDSAPVGATLLWTVLVGGLVAMIDGFDTQAIAFVAPVLIKEWGVPPASFGVIFSAGLFGIMIGQFVFSPLADRFGRKRLIVAGALWFGLVTLATAWVRNPAALLAMRFVGGIGLGGVTPNLIALMAEYSPRRLRATLITVMFGGFPLGAVVGGYLAAIVIPTYGWPAVFVLGGAAALALIPILVLWLPESVRYMVAASAPDEKVRAVLDRVDPARVKAEQERYLLPEAQLPGLSVKHLFSRDLGPGTLLLWAAFFASLLMTYVLLSWLPTVLREAGLSINTAILSAVMMNLGGAVGGIGLGQACDRLGAPLPVLIGAYLIAGLAILSIGLLGAHGDLLMGTIFIAGFFTIGGQTALNAVTASFYPTQVRATGVGYALGFGRIGSIVGPLVGGALVAAHWTPTALFAASATPSLVAALALAGLLAVRRRAGARGPVLDPAEVPNGH